MQAGAFRVNQEVVDWRDGFQRPRNTNARGITILAKNCAINYLGTHINVIDTPGHSDFGGEVERVLSMADGCCSSQSMPPKAYCRRPSSSCAKRLANGLRPIVVINKIDRADARPHEVLNQVFDLFVELGASDRQLDFPHVFSIGRQGLAKREMEDTATDLRPLFETIMAHVRRRPAMKTRR